MPDVKLKIQKVHQEGKSQKELAETFGVSQSQVSVIVRNVKNTSDNQELFEHCWYWEKLIENLNVLRDKYLETKDYKYFRLIRQLIPMSYLYKSTITMNYENILNMYHQRCVHPHKLSEWSVIFKAWVESLPYANELIIGE
jgi:predicted transcriptional regulator